MLNHNNFFYNKLLLHFPTICIATFVFLFIYSSTLYPGGSQFNSNSIGFSWIHNYWCNLMNVEAGNGQLNPARKYSITALIVLSFGLMIFFINFGIKLVDNYIWKWLFILSSIFSMVSAMLIFSEYHDLMTIISSLFGLVIVIGILRKFYYSEHWVFKMTGFGCIVILVLNNFIYYTEIFLEALPLIQKISIVIILTWIVGLNYQLEYIKSAKLAIDKK